MIPAALLSIALVLEPGTPLRVALDDRLTVERVGQAVTATVVDDIYAYDRIVIPKGTQAIGHIARLDELSKGIRTMRLLNGDFSRLHRIAIQFDTLVFSDGRRMSLATTPVIGVPGMRRATAEMPESDGKVDRARKAAEREVSDRVHAITDRNKMERLREYLVDSLPYHREHLPRGTLYAAELAEPLSFGTTTDDNRAAPDAVPMPGSMLRARLVSPLSSATSGRGTAIRALLTEPVRSADGKLMLPAGTELGGEVTFTRAARRLHRNGQLRFLFQNVRVSAGEEQPLQASLAATEVGQGVAIDEEGGVHATETKARFAAPVIAAVILKGTFANDPIEAGEIPDSSLGAPGANVLGRGAGGFIGLGVIGIALSQTGKGPAVALGLYGLGRSVYSNILGKGRDVVMPAGTPLQLQLSPVAAVPPSATDEGSGGR
jgi:hypothetical protein